MRLLFLTQYLDHIQFFFLQELAARTELTVVFQYESDWTTQLAGSPLRLAQLAPRSRWDADFRARLEQLWSEAPWDLAQSLHGNAQLANLIQWNKRGIPLVGYRGYIGHLKFRENPSAYWSVRSPKLAAVVANSTAVKEYLESFGFLRPRNVHWIPHGVNRRWIESQADEPFGLKERLGIPDDAFVVMSMAALRPFKRFEVVVKAARELEDRNIHFVHIGDAKHWEQRARSVGNLHFLGHQPKPFSIVRETDIFQSTSHYEAFGRSCLEANALGKPVIGSNTGGMLDLIDDGVTGFFFKSKDHRDFARKILTYADNRELVESHGADAIRRVDKQYSTERMAERYTGLYQELLQDTVA